MSDNDSTCNSHSPHSTIHGSGLGEQSMAGVNLHEHPFSAAAKVETYRRNNGLDIYTGMPVQRQQARQTAGSGRAAADHVMIADSTANARGGTLRKTVKVIFAILGCLLVLCIIDTVRLLATYSLENPPPNITGKAR